MIPEINQLIDNALRSTFRPPLYLEPFKRLSWVCNESDEKIAIEGIFSVLPSRSTFFNLFRFKIPEVCQ